jgi:membrane-associated phospholipid phosphatase
MEMKYRLRDFFSIEKKPVKGLIAMEWAVLCYLLLTSVIMLFMFTRLHNPEAMLMFRLRVVVLTLATWGLYRLMPSRVMMLLRVGVQIYMLADWYPDTYEFNRCFGNLDHVFASWEQSLFGFQPAIEMSKHLPWGIISEPLDLGYAAYYPIILFTVLFYFIYRSQKFERSVFVIMASFFAYYVVFIFVPVAGPTFYFKAVGIDIISQGVFPNVGNYFETHHDLALDCLPTPGWRDGLMWKAVELAKWAGERPTAAFPSSHVGITTVCLMLLWETGNRRVFFRTLPLGVLMFFATVYIQAHYAIDAIAGILSGIMLYYVFTLSHTAFAKKGGR